MATNVALTAADRTLLRKCIARDPQAWAAFVDRFSGVIYHTILHTAHMRSISLEPAEVDDLASEVVLRLVDNDMRVLRDFRGRSSLATYIAVIARRVTVTRLGRRQAILKRRASQDVETMADADEVPVDLRIETEDEVHALLASLSGREAELVRSFYLEGKSYHQISQEMGIPEEQVGNELSRLRRRLRERFAP